MSNGKKFFVCKHCGNIVGMILDKGVPLVCCGEKMAVLEANTTDAATEKHVPVVTKTDCGIRVAVGSAMHPSTAEHHILFVYVETENGGQRKAVAVGTDPVYDFSFVDDKPCTVFAYCNLHGLWAAKVD